MRKQFVIFFQCEWKIIVIIEYLNWELFSCFFSGFVWSISNFLVQKWTNRQFQNIQSKSLKCWQLLLRPSGILRWLWKSVKWILAEMSFRSKFHTSIWYFIIHCFILCLSSYFLFWFMLNWKNSFISDWSRTLLLNCNSILLKLMVIPWPNGPFMISQEPWAFDFSVNAWKLGRRESKMKFSCLYSFDIFFICLVCVLVQCCSDFLWNFGMLSERTKSLKTRYRKVWKLRFQPVEAAILFLPPIRARFLLKLFSRTTQDPFCREVFPRGMVNVTISILTMTTSSEILEFCEIFFLSPHFTNWKNKLFFINLACFFLISVC